MDVRSSRFVGGVLIAFVGLVICTPAFAQRPWQNLQLFKRIEIDPNNSFKLSDRQGPWMIMCVTFTGEEAEKQARELVHELRSVHKLPAYTQNKEFDYTERTTGRGVDRYGQPRRMKYNVDKKINEVAVLVGDFSSINDPLAQKALTKIKYLFPDCLNPEKVMRENEEKLKALESKGTLATEADKKLKSISRPLGAFRTLVQEILPEDHENKKKGPMYHAFITGNPLIPREYFAPKGIDKLVYDMNKPLPNSLLNCPRKYTVKVATFTGKVVIDPKAIKEIEAGNKAPPSGLAEAAEKAHLMCEALRTKGYEAYEFHDRHASIVTVGSFDSVGTPRTDGKIEIDPQVHTLIETFSAPLTTTTTGAKTRGDARSIVNLPFDSQALPVEVPKSNLIIDYDRSSVVQR